MSCAHRLDAAADQHGFRLLQSGIMSLIASKVPERLHGFD